MRIAVVSDLHGDRGAETVLAARLPAYDRIFYLGDGSGAFVRAFGGLNLPLTAVRGNCDTGESFPDFAVEEICGARFFLTHGHRYNVNASLVSLSFAAREHRCDFALFGHTHIRFAQSDDALTLFNPGSAARPRLGRASFGALEWDGSKFLTKFEDISYQID